MSQEIKPLCSQSWGLPALLDRLALLAFLPIRALQARRARLRQVEAEVRLVQQARRARQAQLELQEQRALREQQALRAIKEGLASLDRPEQPDQQGPQALPQGQQAPLDQQERLARLQVLQAAQAQPDPPGRPATSQDLQEGQGQRDRLAYSRALQEVLARLVQQGPQALTPVLPDQLDPQARLAHLQVKLDRLAELARQDRLVQTRARQGLPDHPAPPVLSPGQQDLVDQLVQQAHSQGPRARRVLLAQLAPLLRLLDPPALVEPDPLVRLEAQLVQLVRQVQRVQLALRELTPAPRVLLDPPVLPDHLPDPRDQLAKRDLQGQLEPLLAQQDRQVQQALRALSQVRQGQRVQLDPPALRARSRAPQDRQAPRARPRRQAPQDQT